MAQEPISDFITSYLNPMPMERQILLAKEMLSKTSYGQKGLIRPIEVDGRLKFESTYIDPIRARAGQAVRNVADTFQEAAQYISGFGITEIADIQAGKAVPSVYRGYGQVLKDINIANNLTGSNQFNAQILIHKAEAGSKSIIDFMQQMRAQGTGLVFATDEGAMALNFSQGKRVLTTEETLEAMQKAGRGLFSQDELFAAMQKGNAGLSKLFAKLPKRLKGVLSPRDISMSDDLLQAFLGGQTKGLTVMEDLASKTLNVDVGFEIAAKAFGLDTSKSSAKQADVAAYIEDLLTIEGKGSTQSQAKTFVNNILNEIMNAKGLDDTAKAQIRNDFENLIRTTVGTGEIDAAKAKYGSQLIKDKMSNLSHEKSKEIIKELFDEMEKGFDGSSLINTKFAIRSREFLQKELSNLSLKTDEQSIMRATEIRRQLKELTFKDGEAVGLSQVTVRGSVRIGDKDYSYKSAAQIKRFADRFDKYGIITSISGLKSETAVAAGTPILNLSGLAEATDRVYTDPMLVAFHDAAFGNQEDFKIMEAHRRQVLQEFQETLQRGYLTEDSEILKSIRYIADRNLDESLEAQRFSRGLNKEWAERVMELHRSGVKITDSPEFLNLLHTYTQTDLYKIKNGQRLPVAGDVYRFALNSEANALTGVKGAKRLLSGKGELVRLQNEAGDIFAEMKIAKFRVSNHNILFHENDIRKFYHALGGFDLDDKGLPILGTYMSEGKRRLGAAMVRQPTSAGEIIGLTRFEDIESYRQIFGGNRFFTKTLDELAQKDKKFLRLKMALEGKGPSDELINKSMMNKIEQLTIEVNDKLNGGVMRQFNKQYFERIGMLSGANAKYSATQLIAMGAEDPSLIGLGFRKLRAEIEDMPLEADLFKSVEDLLNPQQQKQLGAMTASLAELRRQEKDVAELSKNFYESFNQAIKGLDSNLVLQRISGSYLGLAADAVMNNENILGQYINRTTFIGHGLKQFEEAFRGNTAIERELLNKKLMLGFPSAESTIDMTQTFTSGRMIMQYQSELAMGDERIAAKALEKLYGKKALNLGELGSSTVEQYGKMFGYLSQKSGFNAVIDEAFIRSGKINKNDLILLAKNIADGMVEATPNADVSDLRKAAESGNFETVQEALRSRGLLGKGSMSLAEEIANMSEYSLNATTRTARKALINRQQELVSKTTKESRTAAEILLDQNKNLLDEIQADIKRSLDPEYGEIIKADLHARKMQLGDNLLKGVQDISDNMGISGYEMMSSLEYVGNQRRVLPGILQKLPDATSADNQGAALFHRYMDMAQKRQTYEKSVRNVELRSTIDDLFTKLSDAHRAGILDNDLNLSFADDFFGTGRNSQNIASVIKNANIEGVSAEERQIGIALRQRVVYEQARFNDPMADAFINGSTASRRVVQTVSDITETTPGVVADTLRELERTGSRNISKNPYKRITREFLSEQFAKPTVQKVAIGVGLAIAASFLYQNKKDHTKEDIAGPPLLPGGSAYEQGYPNRVPEISRIGGAGYTAGMNYKVSLYGNRDEVERFRQAASGLTNGGVSSTMYNRIPDVAEDPYQSMARSY